MRHAQQDMPAALRAVAELEAVGGVSDSARRIMRDEWEAVTAGALA